MILILIHHLESTLLCIYWNSKRELYFVKRFLVEKLTKKHSFIDSKDELVVVSTAYKPKVNVSFNKRLKETKDLNDKTFELNSLIDIKGDKAQGNQLTKLKVKDISLLPVDENDSWPSIQEDDSSKLDEDLQESAEHNSSDQVNNEKESSRDDSTT